MRGHDEVPQDVPIDWHDEVQVSRVKQKVIGTLIANRLSGVTEATLRSLYQSRADRIIVELCTGCFSDLAMCQSQGGVTIFRPTGLALALEGIIDGFSGLVDADEEDDEHYLVDSDEEEEKTDRLNGSNAAVAASHVAQVADNDQEDAQPAEQPDFGAQGEQEKDDEDQGAV